MQQNHVFAAASCNILANGVQRRGLFHQLQRDIWPLGGAKRAVAGNRYLLNVLWNINYSAKSARLLLNTNKALLYRLQNKNISLLRILAVFELLLLTGGFKFSSVIDAGLWWTIVAPEQ